MKGDNILAVASVSFSPGFSSSFSNCWKQAGAHSLYASQDEFQNLIKEVLSWDIRSLSQVKCPHVVSEEHEGTGDEESCQILIEKPTSSDDVVYHLILEGIDISYKIDGNTNILVETASVSSIDERYGQYNYSMWQSNLSS